MSIKSIKLAHGVKVIKDGSIQYKVITVKNSTVYNPGQVLCKSEVDDLCNNSNWDVTIVGLKEDA